MQIFLDTANIEQVREAAKLGVIAGVTTNPSLMSKEGTCDYQKVTGEICAIIKGSVSVEVLSEDAVSIVKEAREKAAWAPNATIKIPCTAAGLQAIATLSKGKNKIETNMTLVFSANQALLGALAGATYVSVFVGRLDDAGHDGMQVVRDTVEIFDRYKFPTKVIAASIRHPMHCVEAAKAGAHVATVPYNVLMLMMQHPLTDTGIARFLADWKKVAKK